VTRGQGHGRRLPFGWTAAATLVTGLLGWVAMVVVARGSGPRDFASFAVLWGLFFGVGGAFAGLQQEVTRSAALADRGTGRTRLLPVILGLTVPSAVVGVAVVASGSVRTPGGAAPAGVALASGLVALGVLTFVNGVLAARDHWPDLALVLVGDAVLRTAAVVAAVAAETPAALPWAIAVGALAWLPLLVRPPVRATLAARGADPVRGLVRRALTAMGSTVCAALLVAGFPLMLSVVRGHEDLTSSTGVLLATLVLVRSPMLVLIYGFRPAILRAFLDTPGSLGPAVGRWWILIGGLGAVATALAAAAGPWLVRLVFGDAFSASSTELAALTAGSVLLGLLVVSGLALVAADRHTASTLGWLAAVVLSAALLAAVTDTRTALLLAVLVAPLAGLAVHAVALRRAKVVAGAGAGPAVAEATLGPA
jgi:O-antigen/teichoic acid export membrane protein